MTVAVQRDQVEQIDMAKFWPTFGIVVGASVVANLIIRIIATTVFPISPEFLPLGWGPPIIFTVIGLVGAAAVFLALGRFTKRPATFYRIIATVFLFVSLIPNIQLLGGGDARFSGVTPAAVYTLMAMHIPPYLLSVWLFTTRAMRG